MSHNLVPKNNATQKQPNLPKKKKICHNLREETHGAGENTTLENHVTMLNIKNYDKKKGTRFAN